MSEQRANVVAFIEKGLHYFSIGRMEEARVFWTKALELDPHNAQVHQFLQHLEVASSAKSGDSKNTGGYAAVSPAKPAAEPRWTQWSPGKAGTSDNVGFLENQEPVRSFTDIEEVWLPQEDEPIPRRDTAKPSSLQGKVEPHLPQPKKIEPPPLPRSGTPPQGMGAAFGSGQPSGSPHPAVRRPPSGNVDTFVIPSNSLSPNTAGSSAVHRVPSGSYPVHRPPTGSHAAAPAPATRPPVSATRPPAAQPPPPRQPSGVFPSFPPPTKPPTGIPPSVVKLGDPISSGSPKKPDLSTRFLPSLQSLEVNPAQLLGDANPLQMDWPNDLAAPVDAFSESGSMSPDTPPSVTIASASQEFSGSFSGDHDPKDLSTRYLKTVSSQHISPEDLLGADVRQAKIPPKSASHPQNHPTSSQPAFPRGPVAPLSVSSFSLASAQDRSTRMIPSLQAQGVDATTLEDMLGESTQDTKSPFVDTASSLDESQNAATYDSLQQAPAALHPESPSLVHIQAVPVDADLTTRYLRTVKSEQVEIQNFLPSASPEGPTEVQPIPFGADAPPPFLGPEQPPLSKSKDRSTQFFPSVLASPQSLLPNDDFSDIELFGENPSSRTLLASSEAPVSQIRGEAAFAKPHPPTANFPPLPKTSDHPAFQEEPLSTRLQMEPLPAPTASPTWDTFRGAVYPKSEASQDAGSSGFSDPSFVQDDLEFLLGGETSASMSSSPEEDILDVLSDDSFEIVFVGDEGTTDSSLAAPLTEDTPPQKSPSSSPSRPMVPFDVAFGNAATGEFDVATGPVKVKAGQVGRSNTDKLDGYGLENADTGEFEVAPFPPVQVRQRSALPNVPTGEFSATSQPVVVQRGGKGESAVLSPLANQALSPMSPHMGSPFEPMKPGAHQQNTFLEPGYAETLLPEDAPPPVASDGTTSEHSLGQVFDMPTSTGPAEHTPPETSSGLSHDLSVLLSGIEDLLAEEDFVGAKELLDVAMQQAPSNAKIKILYQLCEKKVAEIYRQQFHSLQMIPRMIVPMQKILSLRLNHRDGYILSQIDGITSISDILAISGFDENELFSILGQLNHRGVIKIE